MIDPPVPAMAPREDAKISVHDDCLALILTVRLEIFLTVRYTLIFDYDLMAAQRSSIKARNQATAIRPRNHFLNLSINFKPSLFSNKAKTCYNIITSTLHIFAATHNSDYPHSVWTRDPSSYNIIMNTEPGRDRQETLASAAKQLRKETKGATAFDYNWLFFPLHIRHNH